SYCACVEHQLLLWSHVFASADSIKRLFYCCCDSGTDENSACNLSNLTTGDLNLLHCKSSFEYSGVGFPSLYSVFFLRLQSLDFLQKLWVVLQCLTKSFRINASGSLNSRLSLNIAHTFLNRSFLNRVVRKFRSIIILSLGR